LEKPGTNNDDKWRRDKSPPQPVEGVLFNPLKTSQKNTKGGDSPLRSEWPTKKMIFVFLGKVRKGSVSPFDCIGDSSLRSRWGKARHPEERKRRGVSSLNRGGEQTLLELYPKRILSLSRGKFERGTFAPFDWRGDVSLRSKWLKDRHSEPPLRGVSSLNRGGEQTLLNSTRKQKRRRCLTSFDMTQ